MKISLFLFLIIFLSSRMQAQVKDSIIENIYDEHYVVKRNDRFLLLDSQKNVIQDCDSIYRTHKDDREYVIAKKENWGVIDFNGKVRIPFEYDFIRPMYYSMFIENRNDSEEVDDSKDIFLVQKNGRLGEINFNNEIVLPIEYDAITDWVEYGPEGHFVSKNGKIGLIKYTTEVIIPPIYDSLYVEHFDDIIKAKLKGKFGAVNSKHEIIIPFKYDALIIDRDEKKKKKGDIYTTYLKMYIVKLGEEWMYLNKKGKIKKRGISQKEIEQKYIDLQSMNPYHMLNNYDFKYVGYCMIKPKKI